MRRREFIALVGGATAWPLVVRAQQPAKLPTIGILIPGSHAGYDQRVSASVQRLQELGWIDGRTITIDYRWAEDQRFDQIAADFVRRKVDVVLTGGTPPVLAVRNATSDIPIVLAAAGDPVGSGLVASLARPGGNITGVSVQSRDIAGKRLSLLREIVPELHRLGIMGKTDNVSAASEMRDAQAVAGAMGLKRVVRNPECGRHRDQFRWDQGSGRCTLCRGGFAGNNPWAPDRHVGRGRKAANHAWRRGAGRGRWPYVLWRKLPGRVAACRR